MTENFTYKYPHRSQKTRNREWGDSLKFFAGRNLEDNDLATRLYEKIEAIYSLEISITEIRSRWEVILDVVMGMDGSVPNKKL